MDKNMINIFQINKGAYNLNDIEVKFLNYVFEFLKINYDDFDYLDHLNLQNISFKFAPEFQIGNTGIFGSWNILYNNCVFLIPYFFDKRLISYVQENYDKDSDIYRMYSNNIIYKKYQNLKVDTEKINQISYLIGSVITDNEIIDSLVITSLHELYHKYQFKRNLLSYVIKFFIQLIIGYDNTLNNDFFLEGEVRSKVENKHTFKIISDFIIFFNSIQRALVYVDKRITYNNELNKELSTEEKADLDEKIKTNDTNINEIIDTLKTIDNKVYDFCMNFCKQESIFSDDFIENFK